MNLEIARNRYREVFKVDVIDNSEEDFLATHVPFTQLCISKKFDPTTDELARPKTEEEIYQEVIEPTDFERFVLVRGNSGTGKSHLIRWFHAYLQAEQPEHEKIIFISRNNNTLKGTLKQLLDIPEVSQISNREMYMKLVNAASVKSEDELKVEIYYEFIKKVENDDEGTGDNLREIAEEEQEQFYRKPERRRLLAFLKDESIKDQLMSEDGPIRRILSKIINDGQTVADELPKFVADDFEVAEDAFDMIQKNGEKNAQRFASAILGDLDGTEKEKLALYLNTFVEDVILRCSGLEQGNLDDIMMDIRKELRRQGFNLTVFIEDITSFTGISAELVGALMVGHTGRHAMEGICRINAIVGCTDGYFNTNFRDNYKERISCFISVPDDPFANDINKLYEFFARYLNTISLDRAMIEDWVKNYRADQAYYPIANSTFGNDWGFYDMGSEKKISLFPFTKNAIEHLYSIQPNGEKKPRSIIRDIIEPYVDDALNDIKAYPAKTRGLKGKGMHIQALIASQKNISQLDKTRLIQLMCIWGNGTNDVSTNEFGQKTIGGLTESVYNDVGLPILEGAVVEQGQENVNPVSEPVKQDDEKEKKVAEVQELIRRWVDDSEFLLPIGNNVGIEEALTAARKAFNQYVYDAIDWKAEGVTKNRLSKVFQGKDQIISFQRQRRGKSFPIVVEPAEAELVLLAFVRYRIYGDSWCYKGSADDLYQVNLWLEKNKARIIDYCLRYDEKEADYISYDIAYDIYAMMINGNFSIASVQDIMPDSLWISIVKTGSVEGHSATWQKLMRTIEKSTSNAHENVLQYYNLPQGDANRSENYFMDYVGYVTKFKEVMKTGLHYSDEMLQTDDPVVQRSNSSKNLQVIVDKIDQIVEDERRMLMDLLDKLKVHVNVNTVSESNIDDIYKAARRFYKIASEAKLSVVIQKNGSERTALLKDKAKSIKNSIDVAKRAVNITDSVEALLCMSSAPAKELKPFVEYLEILAQDMEKVNEKLKNHGQDLSDDQVVEDDPFVEQRNMLDECDRILGEASQ